MKQILFIIILSISININAFSQKNPDRQFVNKFYDASAFIYENNYGEALPLLKDLDSIKPDNANIQFLLGLCYLKSRIYQQKAEEKLAYASDSISKKYQEDNHREQNSPPETWFFLGQAYRINSKFVKSQSAFENYVSYLEELKETKAVKLEKEETSRQIEITKRAEQMVNSPVKIDMVNMGVINSEYSDHSPVLNVQESKMIFTSKRPSSGEPSYNQDEDLFVTYKEKGKWTEPERMGDHINTEANEASIGLSTKGDILLFFRSEYQAGNIFTTNTKNKDSTKWDIPKQLTEEINTKNRETHACITPDNQSIYFTSDRPGGYGGLDIYVVRKLPTGEFGEPRLLGPNVNTEYDEETPFIHPDGQTLFFSSKGHNTMGGFDIFYSKMNEDYTFGPPSNMGYPINTTGDNVAYVMSMDGRRGYLSTYQSDGYGDLDIYMIKHEDLLITNLVIYKGTVNDSKGKIPKNIVIEARDTNNDIAGTYIPDKNTGEYILSLCPQTEYNIIYNIDGYQMVSNNIKTTKKTSEYYFENYKPIELDSVIIPIYVYRDRILFKDGEVNITTQGSKVINKISEMVDTTKASTAVSINYPPSHPLGSERFEVVKQALINANVNSEDIISQGHVPDNIDVVYGLNITESEKPSTEIDLAAKNEFEKNKVVIENILFEFDKYSIKPKYYKNLNRLANYMLENSDAVIEIAGHTDHIGNNEYNYLLSYKRAKAVKDYLVEKGVTPSSLITKKYGENEPVAPNVSKGEDNPDGRKLNRRVGFKVLKEGSHDKLIIAPIDTLQFHAEKFLYNEEGDFTIQIFALKNRRSIDYFDDLIGVKEHVGDDGFYRYYVGSFDTREEAGEALQELQDMGYDPFIREKDYFK
ncbi:MAG: OmpA family protein [Bacteroidota bacterium]